MMRRSVILVGLLALTMTIAAPLAAAAPKGTNNAGTIKVHDDESVDPPTQNQPHVSCDFWIEGFNMQDSSGVLVFRAWPPTGNKQVVTPTGDGLAWTADSGNDHGNFHFLNGAYQLPAGHYKVQAENANGTKTKSKVFWVDPCEQPCTEDCHPCTTDCNPCPTDTITRIDCPTVPFFPSTASLALGMLGAVGIVGAVVIRRRRG